jgi:serine/threonine protein kinase
MHQLIREIKIQSYCDHPSLTKLYGYFSSVEEIYLITELSSEGQLLQLIQKAKIHNKFIPEAVVTPILRQICEGVRYMHTLKIIHRDIKPENIVMERGVVKICDFGWAVYHNLNLRSTFCGTPLYVSP